MPVQDLVEITADGRMILHFHPGQLRAWDSTAQITAIIAGSQSGKTVFGPAWLYREIVRCGPGDYLVASPTFALMELKVLPEFKRLFEETLQLGKYTGSPVRKFTVSRQGEVALFGKPQRIPTVVYFGYAENPNSLESMTVKAAWLDEAGQKEFKLASFEAIIRRLNINKGRILITTTPYDLGWLKTRIWNKRRDPKESIKVVRFDSTENPAFPQEAMDSARRSMPLWRFNLFYRGIFTRPAGMIYDCFDDSIHTCPRFPIPDRWARYVGMDYGGVHTAALFLAEEPTSKRLFAYREYLEGHKTARQHADDLMGAGTALAEPRIPTVYGGAKSEQQWRDEFTFARFPTKEPKVSDVEVGISRVYGVIKTGGIIIFDDLSDTLEEINTYSRKVDDHGNVTEEIDHKNKFHLLDAGRYIIASIREEKKQGSHIFNRPQGPGQEDPDDDLAWGERYNATA